MVSHTAIIFFLMRPRRITQCSCLEDNLPVSIWHFCINLANMSFPRKIHSRNLMMPMGIDINNSKGSVSLTSNINFNRFAVIVIVIVIKETIPVLAPTLSVKTPEFKNPFYRVVCTRMRRSRPNHIWMNDR